MTYTTEDYFNANEFIPDEKKTKFRHKNSCKAIDECKNNKKECKLKIKREKSKFLS